MENQLLDQSYQAAHFLQTNWSVVSDQAQAALPEEFKEVDEIIICGCGDSHHAAVGMELAIDLWSKKSVRSAPAMYASRYLIPRVKDRASRYLVIGISSSGEVARTIEAIELARDAGARTLALTANPQSTLGMLTDSCISIEPPSYEGPGLLSYLGSLLMGYAVCAQLAPRAQRIEVGASLEILSSTLENWIPSEIERGRDFAEQTWQEGGFVFVAGGSLYGTALFSAAKMNEAAGSYAWAQELEEWAHLEYFCKPSGMPTWFLSCEGRTMSREVELIDAAGKLGRKVQVSRWAGHESWSSAVREILAPLALWVGPITLATSVAERLGEEPFRGFGGGRSAQEGGGASRIRSSHRYSFLRDFVG